MIATTTIAAALRDCEIDDARGMREEIALTGKLTDGEGNLLVVVDEYTGLPIGRDRALGEINEWVSAREGS